MCLNIIKILVVKLFLISSLVDSQKFSYTQILSTILFLCNMFDFIPFSRFYVTYLILLIVKFTQVHDLYINRKDNGIYMFSIKLKILGCKVKTTTNKYIHIHFSPYIYMCGDSNFQKFNVKLNVQCPTVKCDHPSLPINK